MKIAMLTNNYKPFTGGVPISVERQARHLANIGNEVTVFAPDYGKAEEEQPESMRVLRFRTRRKKMENGMVYPCFLTPEILKVFEKETFDCIHVHHPMFVGTTALYLKKKYQIPVIYTYHTKYEDYLHYLGFFREAGTSGHFRQKLLHFAKERFVPAYMRWFCNQCDLVIAPTPGVAATIRRQGVRTKVKVLPTGLEEEFYKPDTEKTADIRYRYAAGKKWLFCTVGRLEEEKNPGFLIEGLKILSQKERLGSDFHMLFIGTGSLKEQLQDQIRKEGLESQVTFLGNVPNEEVKHYLYASDLFLFASTSETQGIVLAEAMAAGCPVVAVKASGVEDIVEDNRNGFAVENDPGQWTQKVEEALCPEKWMILQETARNTAKAYQADRIARREELLYRRCMRLEQGGGEYVQTMDTEEFAKTVYGVSRAS